MAVRHRCLAGIAAVVLASCSAPGPASPTPPPGLAVQPTAQVVDALDPVARSHWKTISPGVRGLVLASSATALVSLVEYAKSSTVVDPYKDNFRYVIEGDGMCQVEATKLSVRAGDLVVAPKGVARGCTARRKTLTLLTVSFARGQSRVGISLQAPPAGRINAAKQMHSLAVVKTGSITQGLYEGYFGEILAAKGGDLTGAGLGNDVDRFIYVRAGVGSASLDGRSVRISPGAFIVVPANARFSMRARGAPLEALVVVCYRQVSEI